MLYLKKSVTIPEDVYMGWGDLVASLAVHWSPLTVAAMQGMLKPGPLSFMPVEIAGGRTGFIMEYGDFLAVYYCDPDGRWIRYAVLPRLAYLARYNLTHGTWIERTPTPATP